MWFQIEREADRDGIRYYWTIFEGEDTVRAASLKHFEDREQAIESAVYEMRTVFNRNVTAPLREINIGTR